MQELILCERVTFIRRRVLAYESAVLAGTDPSMDAGTFSNHVNVLNGLLKSLGLGRRARNVPNVREYLAASNE